MAADPLNLDAVTATGATFTGARVKSVILILDDDRRHRLDLPLGKPSKDWTKTKPGQAVLSALGDAGGVMKGATLAKAAGYPYTGSFRQCLKGLADAGEITHDEDDGYSLPTD